MLRIEVADATIASLDALEVESIAAFVGAERPLSGLAALLDWRLAGALSRAILAGTVTPEEGEALLLPVGGRLKAARIFVFGVDDATPRSVARAVRHACEALRRAGARSVAVGLPLGAAIEATTRAWVDAAAGAGFDRQVILGDPRPLPGALEAAGRDAGVAVQATRIPVRAAPPTA